MTRRPLAFIALFSGALAAAATPASAQTRLTLAAALERGREQSEVIAVAHAGESRADAAQMRASGARLPQLAFTGGYDRTLASQFSDFGTGAGPTCTPLSVDATQPLDARLGEIERAASCGALGGFSGLNFSTLPFGQRDVYQYTFAFSQPLYAGGRIVANERLARASRDAATLTTSTAEAQVSLEITRAFFDAALSDRLLAIAESGERQAAATLDLTRLAYDAGRQPEFELLRAQVARDNQRPVVIRRRADRDVAYLRLRTLLELPIAEPLVLDVDLDAADLVAPAPFAAALAATATTVDDHVSVRQAAALVRMREAAVAVARADGLPSLSLNSNLGQVGYPSDGSFPRGGDFRTNWSASALLQMPIFTGRRVKSAEMSARADLAEAQAQLRQARELSTLDAATAQQDLVAAEAVWQASAGTVQQAERAYQIAELRNREGLSTQLELSDSRLSLQIAQANRAMAARDVQVARARVALQPSLPVLVR